MNNNPLVYSTETGRTCSLCGKPVSTCACKKKKRGDKATLAGG